MSGRTALITGGAGFIGKAMAETLAELGADIVILDRDLAVINEVADAISRDFGVRSFALEIDLENAADKLKVKSFLEKNCGSLDVLINNAGILIGNSGGLDVDLEEVKEIMETNFYGPWQLTQKLLPLLRKSKEGRIINMSSCMGALDELMGDYAGYRMSKSALNALTILMANELADTTIKVNAMCPGWVKTEMGGDGAPRNVDQGADTAVWLSTEENISSSLFYRDRKVISW